MSVESKRILLSEDNLVNQKLTTMLLRQLGLTVDVVDNGRKAVQAAQQHVYAVIFMDCQMPEMDGFEATRAIRKLELLRGTYTPIIAVTALAMVGDRERCIQAGMDDYISKPIDRRMLKIKLDHWLEKDFVLHNQELVLKYTAPQAGFETGEEQPINLVELADFYGEDLEDVVAVFAQTTERLLKEIGQAVNKRHEVGLAHMAHELKGSSAAVGAKGMAKLALFLERAAGMRDWKEARDTCLALEDAFQELRHFLMRHHGRSFPEVAVLPTRD